MNLSPAMGCTMRARFRCLLVLACLVGAPLPGVASTGAGGEAARTGPSRDATAPSASQWLMRLQDASRNRAYSGTFVVSSSDGQMASARIWHVCDGQQQVERIDSLTGEPRSTYRLNDQVVTFLPQSRVARISTQDAGGPFPNLLRSSPDAIDQIYTARVSGLDRVAGQEAEVVLLLPRDADRWGYRIWAEKRTGLAVKMQTLDRSGRVLEQSAFSELKLESPVSHERLQREMQDKRGYRVERVDAHRTTPEAEGWQLAVPVAGFQSMGCLRRGDAGAPASLVQWVFSDGLATVSLFIEPFEPGRHAREGLMSAGATHTLTLRRDKHWVTAVGEVPAATLRRFAGALSRR